jgi:DNA-binding NtrC family response regulator
LKGLATMLRLETIASKPLKLLGTSRICSDLVITDQTMPDMTGADIARRMIQIRPGIPIILCTGYSTVISDEKAKSMGIKEFAVKPLSKKNMAVLIRKVLDNS